MKKGILNLGKALNKEEQKQISGGTEFCGTLDHNCCGGIICCGECGYYGGAEICLEFCEPM